MSRRYNDRPKACNTCPAGYTPVITHFACTGAKPWEKPEAWWRQAAESRVLDASSGCAAAPALRYLEFHKRALELRKTAARKSPTRRA